MADPGIFKKCQKLQIFFENPEFLLEKCEIVGYLQPKVVLGWTDPKQIFTVPRASVCLGRVKLVSTEFDCQKS